MALGMVLYYMAACLCVQCALCLPIGTANTVQEIDTRTNGTVLNTLGTSVFNSFEDVASFLHKWFRLITEQIATEETHVHHEIRARREVSIAMNSPAPTYRQNMLTKQMETETPNLTFEDLEKQYLINNIMNLLKQMYFYEDYVRRTNDEKHSTTTTTNPQNPNLTPVAGKTTEDPNRGLSHLVAQKLQELNDMSVSRLSEMMESVKNAAQSGHGRIDISRLCCSFG